MKTTFLLLFLLITSNVLIAQTTKSLSELKAIASKKMYEGKLEESQTLYFELLKEAEAQDSVHLLDLVYCQIAGIYLYQANYPTGLQYAHECISQAKLTKDSTYWGVCLLRAGFFHFYLENLDSANLFFQESARIFNESRDFENAAISKVKMGNLLEAKGKYEEATPYFLDYYHTALEWQDSLRLMTAYVNLAGNNYNLQKYDSAFVYLEKFKNFAISLKRDFEYQESLKLEAAIYEGKGEPSKALRTMEAYVAHHDSIVNQQNAAKMAELEKKYETEKKEATILLKEQQLSKERSRFWIAFGGFITAFLIGLLLYFLVQQLRKRNAEKEILLKEIHHRVKNNLQILSSLLRLQGWHIEDSAALDAIKESQNRVESMSLIHQKLYLDDNSTRIEIKEYVNNLVKNLFDSFGISDNRIVFENNVKNMYIDVDTAIPLGLIINELVTNSLKYAFPEERSGKIIIDLFWDLQNRLVLKVQDNGVGRANAPILDSSTSFGTDLIKILSKKLKGTPRISNGIGYQTVIAFEKQISTEN